MMKLKRFLLYNGFNKLQNNLLVPSYGSKIARTLRLVLSDNPTVMVLFMLLRICDLNYRILSHHLYISKNKNKKTHCACKWSYRFHFDPIYEKWTIITTWCVLNDVTNNSCKGTIWSPSPNVWSPGLISPIQWICRVWVKELDLNELGND